MIDPKTVAKIARLARLKIGPDQEKVYTQQLGKILDYFEQISNVPTEGIEPLITPVEVELRLREDVPQSETSTEEILANAPVRAGNLFTVPPVV